MSDFDYKKKYCRSYFMQVGKWGRDLTPTEAMELGLIPKEQTIKKATRRKSNGNNTSK